MKVTIFLNKLKGCLNPIQIVIPKGCLLDPSNDAAVVGGNVETSQRVVDVILKAFAVCAASQGSMNNLTFGDGDSGYYETVAGGAGAGPGWHGRGGVHTHMTNTRITDPEILEKRYPVVLNCFSLNHGSGGRGKYSGGDGVMRELLFRKRLTLSILTERRVFRPYGLFGGEAGQRGLNLLIHADDRVVNLGSKCSVTVSAGDRFRLLTPGGGGYGDPGDDHLSDQEHDHDHKMFFKKRRADKGHHKYAEKGSVHAYKMKQESA
ncbi:5-oxoprolinase-like [Lingula anatina]|uniref:5-oxoprolinase-like n=1 Tax=Lingula anatina TaxID=7574 RepID=A0A1S3K6G8_LINAN|nr:5-oxoprolinase-like [Lingula anatina]|eukprot:XP_013418228.1 5-oxoprolinase-like [Lingula anatina]